MKRIFAVAVVVVLTIGTSPVFARGAYLGGAIGNTFYSSTISIEEPGDQTKKIDENSTAWKIFGGYKGQSFLGLEGGFRHFGKVDSEVLGKSIDTRIWGWDLEAVGHVEINIVDLFAKAGLMLWKEEVSVSGDVTHESGTNFLWGLGAEVLLGPIGVRLEWESVEQGNVDNLSVVSFGVTTRF